jgi:hypothetical protein
MGWLDVTRSKAKSHRLAQADTQFLRRMLRGLAGGHPDAQLGQFGSSLLPLDRWLAGGTIEFPDDGTDALPGDAEGLSHLFESQAGIREQSPAQAQAEISRGEQVPRGE